MSKGFIKGIFQKTEPQPKEPMANRTPKRPQRTRTVYYKDTKRWEMAIEKAVLMNSSLSEKIAEFIDAFLDDRITIHKQTSVEIAHNEDKD